jgi:predicted secreted Zn-dependent protease
MGNCFCARIRGCGASPAPESSSLLAKLFLFLALAASALAQGSVSWTTNYYSVAGATLREIHASFRSNRPWRGTAQHDGYTRWQVDWTFGVREIDNKCRLTSLNTRTTIAITLPLWIAPTNATDEVRQAWQRYITALGQHEAGHGQMALAAAAEMHKRVKESGEDANCDALRQKINSLGQTIIEQYRARDQQYDERTRHGATQGAVLRHRDRDEP